MAEEKTHLDKVADYVPDYITRVLESVRKQLPRPPGTRKMSEAEQLSVYETMGAQGIINLVKQHPDRIPEIENWISKMERIKLTARRR